VLSGRGLCDELITRPEESYRLCCVVVCDLETSRMGAPYIYMYDISRLRVNWRRESCNEPDSHWLCSKYFVRHFVCMCQWKMKVPLTETHTETLK